VAIAAVSAVAFAALTYCRGAVAGQSPTFAVNTYTTGTQIFSTVRRLGNGSFVVAWNSAEQDGFGLGVFARVFDESAQPLSDEIRVNEQTLGDQFTPSIAPIGDGFAIAWQSGPLLFCCTQDGDSFGVYARVFTATGAPATSEFQVNTYTTGSQGNPSVAATDGGFVVVWDSNGQEQGGLRVFSRAFDAAGEASGPEQRVTAQATDDEVGATVEATGSGELITAWTRVAPFDPASTISAHRLDAAGTPVGTEFALHPASGAERTTPLLASAPLEGGASLLAAWSERGSGDDFDVVARAFDAGTTPLGDAARVNLHLPNRQTLTGVAGGADGFVVVWDTLRQDGDSYGVGARRLAADGRPLGPELAVNTYTTGEQSVGQAALLDDGSFVIAWTSAEDGSEYGIVARLFDAESGLAACGDADAGGAITARDALLTLRTSVATDDCLLRACDVNGDGAVTASDALLVLQAAIGLPVDLDC